MTTQIETTTAHEAAQEYIARRDRTTHPAGSFDNAGRWYPADAEHQSCCDRVRTPSRAYPYSYMVHCRTADHVAHLYGVDAKALRREARRIDPPAQPKRKSGDRYYKAIAVLDDGSLVSIYDGETEYVFGETLRDQAHQNHGGGYYVYESVGEALHASMPSSSTLLRQRRAVIRVRCEGRYCKYGDKFAFSRVTPLEFATYPYDPLGHPADIDNSCIKSRPFECHVCRGTGRLTHEYEGRAYEDRCDYCNGHGTTSNY